MKMKRLLLVAVAPILGATASAQTPSPVTLPASGPPTFSPAPTAPAAAELTALLREFLAGASRNDLAAHERFWAADLIYTGSAGRRRGKPDILRDVKNETSPASQADKTSYTAEDLRIQQYGTTAIVAFRLVAATEKDGKSETSNYLNTGTFLQRDGKWQVVAWQATKMADDKEPNK
jgi:hypothetical protein